MMLFRRHNVTFKEDVAHARNHLEFIIKADSPRHLNHCRELLIEEVNRMVDYKLQRMQLSELNDYFKEYNEKEIKKDERSS